ncbi:MULTISPECIES: DNA polymerase III subunit chi [Mesorhizobium]|uniref:DNA polymerase III subunit chi n=1 Tax=Mesorhizobium denitrificans TaxID=2294114 RepID=A0A371XIQ0_9HYPH|nr:MULTISPECIES: DNA polymerase III subunit chi [Mesorhizobium]RFC69089.1 DNA polymerase III subunit chi [Mesorhizobium denitrificans]
MTEVLFYHLTVSTLEDALPGLLERSVSRGWRAVVQTSSEERRNAIDTVLWTFRDDSFLAHGLDSEPNAGEQPILLTTGPENDNSAQIRFLVDGAPPPDLGSYERGVLLFDGHDKAQLAAARSHWRELKEQGHAVTYWQQTEDRRWERKA